MWIFFEVISFLLSDTFIMVVRIPMWYTLTMATMEGAESDEADFDNPTYWNLTEDIDNCDQLLTVTHNVTPV